MSRKKNDDLVYKALADRRRREILDILRDAPKTTGAICGHFTGLDRCTVMQHLRVLETAGLVISRKKGRYKWNYIDAAPIRDIYNRWINRYASPSVELITRLKHDLESGEGG